MLCRGTGRRLKEGDPKELVAPRLNILILKPQWQLGHSKYNPNYFNTAPSLRRRREEEGVLRRARKKNDFTHRTGLTREVTSTWPFGDHGRPVCQMGQ